MLSKSEAVWRHLLHGTEKGTLRYPSVSALARSLGVGISTAHAALSEPARIGAVVVRPGGGLRVRDPFRLAVLWAGRRHLERDVVATWRCGIPAPELERRLVRPGVILGGFGAVVARLGGNTIADYSTVIVYAPDPEGIRNAADDSADGPTTVIVAELDPLLDRYGPVIPLHQAWVDLFGQPDWQAARFTEAVAAGWLADAA